MSAFASSVFEQRFSTVPSHQDMLQPEFLLTEHATPDMRFATRIMAQVQRELAQRNRRMMRVTSRWLELYDYVKMLEEDRLVDGTQVQAHPQYFQGTVSLVRGLGDMLLACLQNDDAEQLQALGVTYPDLAACVEELGDLERSTRSDMSPAMIAEMNQRLFGSGDAGR
jgi:hypothetical protein